MAIQLLKLISPILNFLQQPVTSRGQLYAIFFVVSFLAISSWKIATEILYRPTQARAFVENLQLMRNCPPGVQAGVVQNANVKLAPSKVPSKKKFKKGRASQ